VTAVCGLALPAYDLGKVGAAGCPDRTDRTVLGTTALQPPHTPPVRRDSRARLHRGRSDERRWPTRFSLIVRNILFTVVVPGAGGVYVPWLILHRDGASPRPATWYATPVIVAGIGLYVCCVWVFAVVGRGTPGPWDAPRRIVAAGPYGWVWNPIYIAALFIVLGEAWLFLSVGLLLYAGGLAVAFHLLVIGYEEPRLHAQFGNSTRPTTAPSPAESRIHRTPTHRSDDRHTRVSVVEASGAIGLQQPHSCTVCRTEPLSARAAATSRLP